MGLKKSPKKRQIPFPIPLLPLHGKVFHSIALLQPIVKSDAPFFWRYN